MLCLLLLGLFGLGLGWLLAGVLGLGNFERILAQRWFFDDTAQYKPFASAERAGFGNFYLITYLGFVLLIMSHELFAHGILFAVQRVRLAGLHSNDNCLVGLVTRHGTGQCLRHY